MIAVALILIAWANVWHRRHPMTPEERAEHDAEMQQW